MKCLSKYTVFKQFFNLCKISNLADSCTSVRRYTMFITRNSQAIKFPIRLSSVVCVYSSDNKKHIITLEKKAGVLKNAFEQKKEQLKDTEHRLRQRGEEFVRDIKQQKEITSQKLRVKKEYIIKDIMETKAKVKDRFEEVIEREKMFTIPNVLCVTRIVMSPYLGYVILQENYYMAMGMLLFAGVTDLLDGWIARNWKGQSTKMGSFLDPMADKVLIATLFISLTWQNLIPLPLTLLIVGRDAALVIAAFIIRYMSLPPPRTLSRYFDVTHATVQLAPTFVSKVNTAIQLLLVGTALGSPVFGYVDHPAFQALCAVTAVSTVVSAISYLVSKDTYKFLKKKS
ncbi:hypothetical protein K1T71_010859 [Dendrolimus kikuchii]|uniref:Uncharacterized protein n=1 Tax=Dendrolimus kikuchii TaxID=765133 RepID=A0ACC1CQC1_9NEOP|nr:hypothetical protein K1T71_010859 [Dendrolimus kikuchii]